MKKAGLRFPLGSGALLLSVIEPSLCYAVSDLGLTYFGNELMTVGFDISDTGNGPWTPRMYQGDYQSRIFEVRAL